MARDIDDVHGLSADARRLYDWMIAAFTGDINEAIADAARHGTSISKWPHERLHKAHTELKERGVLDSSAPELKPSRQHATRKKTSPAQLDREIADALGRTQRGDQRGDRVLADLTRWGIDNALVDEVRQAFRAGDHRKAMAIAHDLGWNRASKRGRSGPYP